MTRDTSASWRVELIRCSFRLETGNREAAAVAVNVNVGIYLRGDAPPQRTIANSVADGCRVVGDRPFVFSDHVRIEEADAIVVFGIGGDAKCAWEHAKEAGKRLVFLDKPYIRLVKTPPDIPGYWLLRVAVDAFQPLRYFQFKKHAHDRWKNLGIDVRPYKKRDDRVILFDGASNKYVAWLGLGNGVGEPIEQWADWGQRMVDKIREHTDLRIVYRPRPSKNPVPPIRGTQVSAVHSLEQDMSRCRLVVSHGGNIGYDAVIAGISHFAMGDSIARPVSETDWTRIGVPFIPDEDARRQWLSDIAWCQWNLDEFRSGTAWRYVRETMEVIDGLR